jgi:hypothetical protein
MAREPDGKKGPPRFESKHRCADCNSNGAIWDVVYRRWTCGACWVKKPIQPFQMTDDELVSKFPALVRRLTIDIKG